MPKHRQTQPKAEAIIATISQKYAAQKPTTHTITNPSAQHTPTHSWLNNAVVSRQLLS
jgi:hypothetical protein